MEPQAPKAVLVPASASDDKHCSFCAKSQTEVKKLVAGSWLHVGTVGTMVYICDECIDLCRIIVEEEVEKVETPVAKVASTEEERAFWRAAAMRGGATEADSLLRAYRQRFSP